MTDISATYRDQFPIFQKKTYLASHSLGAVPVGTQANLNRYYEDWKQYGIEAWDGPWWDSILDFSKSIETILSAEPGTVIPQENVTRGLSTIVSCFDWKDPKNEIVTTDLEFTTFYPFLQGLSTRGARIKIVQSKDGISVDPQEILNVISDKTRLVMTAHVYFRSGAIQDVSTLVKGAHQKGALVVIDGYQAAGTVSVQLKDLDVDFYVGGCHKWLCGGPGAGYLYVNPKHIRQLTPDQRGWFGVKDPFSYELTHQPELHSDIFRFLTGTPAIPALYSAKEGLRIISEIIQRHGMDGIRKPVQKLSESLVEFAKEYSITLHSPENFSKRSGVVCLDIKDGEKLASQLCNKNIIVDHRPECGIRVSFHFYNNVHDLDLIIRELKSHID